MKDEKNKQTGMEDYYYNQGLQRGLDDKSTAKPLFDEILHTIAPSESAARERGYENGKAIFESKK